MFFKSSLIFSKAAKRELGEMQQIPVGVFSKTDDLVDMYSNDSFLIVSHRFQEMMKKKFLTLL